MKKLIVTEKPSVAKSIANAVSSHPIGSRTHYTTDDYLITWCYGHLLGLAEPEFYNSSLGDWKIDTLPIIPTFKRIPLKNNKRHLDDISKLINSDEVSSIICATDAGREGELIFRSVYYYSKSKKPVERLWLATMEPSEIKEALKSMKSMAEYDNLYKAATARQEADWLVGINFTRLYTCRYNHVLHVGRVQSPTLAMIVERFRENKNFVPCPYYVIEATVNGTKVNSENFSDRGQAEKSLDRMGNLDCVEFVQETKHTKPPKLFNLTAMQMEANKLFKYSAKQTLDILQTLYEKGYATYPRTDSRYITAAQTETVTDLIQAAKEYFPSQLKDYNLASVDVSRAVNDKKVIEHHALLPTKELICGAFSELPKPDLNIALLLIAQMLEAVYVPAEYECRNAQFIAADGTKYKASEKGLRSEGFLTVKNGFAFTKQKRSDEPLKMQFEKGASYRASDKQIADKLTTAPSLYTDADLLSAMTNISTKYELGTVATRHEIIEALVRNSYVSREKNHLIPTDNGIKLVDVLDDSIKEADFTAQMENSLEQIAIGNASREAFMNEIKQYVIDLTTKLKADDTSKGEKENMFNEKEPMGICPICGETVYDTPKAYSCMGGKGCGFIIWKQICGKSISQSVAKKILCDGDSGLVKGFKAKGSGKKYDAHLVVEDGRVKIKF